VKQKRRERLESEREIARNGTLQDKDLKKGVLKKNRIKSEIEAMWHELENTYNNQAIVKIEDDLKAEQIRLQQLFSETQGQVAVRKQQSEVLVQRDVHNSKIASKGSKLQQQLREVKAKIKLEQEMQRKIMNDIKLKHAEIIRLEGLQKHV